LLIRSAPFGFLYKAMLLDVVPHEFAQDLRGRLILASADFEESVVQIALNPDA